MRIKKIIRNVIGKALSWGLLILVVVLAALTFISALEIKGGLRLLSVRSGSMWPKIPMGSVVVIIPSNQYRVGDVITYSRFGQTSGNKLVNTTTHRITEIREGSLFVTKGDVNPSDDGEPIGKDKILGKVIFMLPLLGFLVTLANTPFGFILLILIPASVVIYKEILSFKKELNLRRLNE